MGLCLWPLMRRGLTCPEAQTLPEKNPTFRGSANVALADRCICGNIYAPDAVFCRKCGLKRPTAEEDAPIRSTIAAEPGTEARTSQDPVSEQLRRSTATRLSELEERCAQHTSNEERLLALLAQLRNQLRTQQNENVADVDIAQREFQRLQVELDSCWHRCNSLEERARELDAEADHLRDTEIQALRSETSQLNRAAENANIEADAAAVNIIGAVYHGSSSRGKRTNRTLEELEARRCVLESLHGQVGKAIFAHDALKHEVVSLRTQMARWERRERNLAKVQVRVDRDILDDAFAHFVSQARQSRRRRLHVSKVTERRIRMLLFASLAQWNDRTIRARKLREWHLRMAWRQRSAILRVWLGRAEVCNRLAKRAPCERKLWQRIAIRRCRPAFMQWSRAVRSILRFCGRFADWVTKSTLLARTFGRWQRAALLSGPFRSDRWQIFRLLQSRLLRCFFLAWVSHVSNRGHQRHRELHLPRLFSLRRGISRLRINASIAQLQNHFANLRSRVGRNRLRNLSQEVVKFWRHYVRFWRRSAACLELQRMRWQQRRLELLRLVLSVFREVVKATDRKQRCNSAAQSMGWKRLAALICQVLFPVWREAIQRWIPVRLHTPKPSARARHLRRSMSHWFATACSRHRLRTDSLRCASVLVERRGRAAVAHWRQKSCTRRKHKDRIKLLLARQKLSIRQWAMSCWRSLLRGKAHERRVSAARSLRILLCDSGRGDSHGGIAQPKGVALTSAVRNTMELKTQTDLKWLGLVDELHRLATNAAEAHVALDDARARRTTLEQAREAERRTDEALGAELDELCETRAEASGWAAKEFNVMENELSRVLQEQLRLRSALRRAGEKMRCDQEAAESAVCRARTLEERLEGSSRACAELVDDRGRRLVELEAWCRKCHDEVQHFEEELELQSTTGGSEHVECQRVSEPWAASMDRAVFEKTSPATCDGGSLLAIARIQTVVSSETFMPTSPMLELPSTTMTC